MLILQLPWDSQPQEAVNPAAEWAGRLTQLSIGGSLYNSAASTWETVDGVVQRDISAAGQSDAPTGAGTAWISAVGTESADFALVSLFVPQSITGAQQIVACDASFAGSPRIFQFRANGSALEFIRFQTSGSTTQATLSTALQIGRPICVVAVSNGQRVSVHADGRIASATTGSTFRDWPLDLLTSSWFTRKTSPASGSGSEASTHLHALRAVIRGGLTDAEARALAENPWQLFDPRRIYIPGSAVGGPGAQSLTPTLYSNAQTFYTPTVSAGAASLAPALYSNAQTFYAPTVTQGAVSLAPTLYSNTQAFYSATVTQGAVLAPALYSNSQSFYAATVSPGAVTLAPALYSNAQSFYSATVLNGGQLLAPDLYSNAQAFYAPTVGVGAVTLTPALFTNSSTFYAANVSDGTSAFIKYFDVLSGRLLILRAL